jgi:hypothetical protein
MLYFNPQKIMAPYQRDGIMDHSRVLLVPFHTINLVMVGIFAALMAVCLSGGIYGMFGALFLQIWLFKYCFVLVQHLADGATEPPVMDIDMLSPFEIRPFVQVVILMGGAWLAYTIGGKAGAALVVVMLATLPASVAILGFGEYPWQAVNPLAWYRVIRGLGSYYAALLVALIVIAAIVTVLKKVELWSIIEVFIVLWCEVAFFSLVGASIFLRRKQLGYEPSRSPERAAAREEMERLKLRARMVDEVFQLVRIGKHVDATAPLARWLRDTEPEHVSKDSYYVAEQSLRWESPLALNTIGSTLIRHLMQYGRPDAALAVFEILRSRSPNFTMDSAADLRTLAEFAESKGREEFAQSMRLETPVIHPKR